MTFESTVHLSKKLDIYAVRPGAVTHAAPEAEAKGSRLRAATGHAQHLGSSERQDGFNDAALRRQVRGTVGARLSELVLGSHDSAFLFKRVGHSPARYSVSGSPTNPRSSR
jgi:hypothetical protein